MNMKSLTSAAMILFVLFITAPSFSQTWKWVSGSSTTTIVPDFGTRGKFQPTNQPPGLENAAMWVGPDSNIYLFGGDNGSSNCYNTIWEYSPTLGEWRWVRGSNSPNAGNNYGTPGYPAETNDPGARSQFAWSAAANGDLWVYGGLDQNGNVYGDLWKYDFSEDRWMVYDFGQYVTTVLNRDEALPSPDTLNGAGDAGGRVGASLYVNSTEDTLYLFCGEGFQGGTLSSFVDIWRIDPINTKEYWVAGPSGDNPNDGGNFSGIFDMESSSIWPAARIDQSLWRTSNGKFYIFGGQFAGSEYLRDLWSWNPANGLWARINLYGGLSSTNEDYIINVLSSYGKKDTADESNRPGSRYGSETWMLSDTQLVIYGGYGYDASGSISLMNDYWLFDLSTHLMTWSGGGGNSLTADSLRPVYGTEDVAADSIYPGARFHASVVRDAEGRVWLFGGQGYASSGSSGYRNDLFELSYPATGVFAGGDGTAGNPYQVATLTQLQSVGSYLDQNFILTANIDASATATWNLSGGTYRGFVPIGPNTSPFTGTLDGNGYTISNLTINRGSTSAVGLFGRIDGTVKNLMLDSVNIIGDSYVGGLAGRDLGDIQKCSVTGLVVGSGDAVGGLTGDVYSGSIEKSYAQDSVAGGVYSGSGTGGLSGSVYGGTITDCYAAGSVSGDNAVGGFMGMDDYYSTISQCYSVGKVSGTSNVGGFVGSENISSVDSCFWNTETSGQLTSPRGTGETTTAMQSASTFTNAGWNFSIVWGISGAVNNGYPYLVGVTDNALAVHATDFAATSEVNSVKLSWSTRTEVNTAGFNILRGDSAQGSTSFKLIASYTTDGSLRGLGTSTTGRAYGFMDNRVTPGSIYRYIIQGVALGGKTEDLSTLSVRVTQPEAYALYQNYPNPFNPSTTIRFDLKEQSTVALEIYNTLGQRILANDYGTMSAGRYDKVVNMNRFASGVYFYRIAATGGDGRRFVAIKKLMLIK
jgi:hypothetical protein